MKIAEYIKELSKRNIFISASGSELNIEAEQASLTSELIEELKSRKAEILAFFDDFNNNEAYSRIPKANRKEFYALSSAQRRLYFFFEFDKESLAYNMPQAWKIEGILDQDRLRKSVEKLIQRHEILRTSFVRQEGEVYQRIQESEGFELEEFEGDEISEGNIIKDFIRPFDLNHGPLIRVGLLKEHSAHILLVDMHHIVTDGVSEGILIRDFMAFYNQETLPEISLQYKDYSEWQQGEDQQLRLGDQQSFWLKEFEEEVAVLELPTDFSRPSIKGYEGNSLGFSIGQEETTQLKALGDQVGATMFMTVFSVFNVLLSKLSNQEDVTIGIPIAGRAHPDLEEVMGMFVNTLAMRNNARGAMTFKDFLTEVKNKSLQCFENQDYQYEKLVEELRLPRDMSRNPLFDVMFKLQNYEQASLDISDFKLEPYNTGYSAMKYDLAMIATEVEDHLNIDVGYATDLFEKETVERFMDYFNRIIATVISNPETRLSEIDVLSSTERETLLVAFNTTEKVGLADETIVDLFQTQVSNTPNHIALEFEDQRISYSELNGLSNKFASYLCDKCDVRSGDFIGIEFRPSIELVVGILAVLKSGGVYVPIDPDYPQDRKDYMISNSDCKLLLNEDLFARFQSIQDSFSNENIDRAIAPTQLAYVIYTSGSTGNPKGVMIQHANVYAFLKSCESRFGMMREGDGEVSFPLMASTSFDISVFELFLPIIFGGKSIVLSRETVKDISALCHVIEKVSGFHAVPSLMEQVMQAIRSSKKELTYAGIKDLFVGGDAVPTKVLEEMRQVFPQARIHVLYGPTESTIFTTVNEVDRDNDTLLKGSVIGQPNPNTRSYILNKHQQLLLNGQIGELCIGGAGIANGYLKNDPLTKEKFIENPFVKGDRLYRTGDLARWLPDGNLEFMGRIDDQVKIRGFRIELGEIQTQLSKHEAIQDALVVAKESQGQKLLIGYYVSRKEISNATLRSHLSEQLPEFMLPAFFVWMEDFPLTSNGKVDKKALPDPEIEAGSDYVGPSNETEMKLQLMWSEVLNLEKDHISTTRSFFELGGHSLKAMMLTNKIAQEFQVEIPIKDFFVHQEIASLSEFINQQSGSLTFNKIPKIEDQALYIASAAQRRLYFLYEFDKNSLAYNMPQAVTLKGELDLKLLTRSVKQLISRHEILRTTFEMSDGDVYQKVNQPSDFSIAMFETNEEGVPKLIKGFIKPFDLNNDLLLRVGLIKIRDDHRVLIVDMHHIITDGFSHRLLIQDFMSFYRGDKLSELDLQYRDYATWQRSDGQQLKLSDQRDFWLEEFTAEVLPLELPRDFQRPLLKGHKGDSISFAIGARETKMLRELCEKADCTMFMTVLSLFNILLSKLSGQTDVTIGTPVAGRGHSDLQNMLGMFVNTLVLRSELRSDLSFEVYLQEVKKNTLAGFDHQDYQYEELVDALNISRDTSRNPLFDVLLAYDNLEKENLEMPGVVLEPYDSGHKVVKFDLDISVLDAGNQLLIDIGYSLDLFRPETISRFVQYFQEIVHVVVKDPKVSIGSINMLTDKERTMLLQNFNDTTADFPRDKTVIDLFEKEVEKNPDNDALVFEGEKLTYGEFGNRVNQVAHRLSDMIVEGDIVGVLCDRSIEMMIGIYAVMKCGAAYLPIDPGYPEARKAYMIEDSGISVVLTIGNVEEQWTDTLIDFVDLGLLMSSSSGIVNFRNRAQPEGLAYIIYTSGSTGKPKGVMIEHRSLMNRLYWMDSEYPIGEGDVVLQKTPISFDVSVWELFWWSQKGAKLCLLAPGAEKEPEIIKETISRERVTTMHFVPSMMQAFLDHTLGEGDTLSLGSLTQIFSSGEALNPNLVSKFHEALGAVNSTRLINLYGPTEATIDVTYFNCDEPGRLTIPIGKPIYNTCIYILDEVSQLQPTGVPGELCIGGVGIARGYLNNESLSRKKFVENPFNPGELMYKTGDRARWLPGGNIEFLGRLDDQVKIRGFRIELGEVQSELVEYPTIQEATILIKGKQGEAYLVAYYVSQTALDVSDLQSYLYARLPEYMVPQHFVYMEAMPLTANGKLDRKSLPDPNFSLVQDHVIPQTSEETLLCQVWAEVLGIAQPGVTDNFFALGGDSIKAIRLASQVNVALDAKIKVADIFTYQTIRQLAVFLQHNNNAGKDSTTLSEIEKNFESWKAKVLNNDRFAEEAIEDVFPMSDIQKGIVFLSQATDVSTGLYHDQLTQKLIIPGFELHLLRRTLELLTEKHPTLRTGFYFDETGQDLQIVYKPGAVSIDLQFHDIAMLDSENQRQFIDDNLSADLRKVFNIQDPGLWRYKVYSLGDDVYVLVFVFHHSIIDGWSNAAFSTELGNTFYHLKENESFKPEPLNVSYKDYIIEQWQSKHDEKVEAFWKNELTGYTRYQFSDAEAKSDDLLREETQIFSKAFTDKLNAYAQQQQLSVKSIGYTAFLYCLNMFSYSDDITSGIVTNSRPAVEGGEEILGCFLNTIPFRLIFAESESWSELTTRVHDKLNLIKQYDHISLAAIAKVVGETASDKNPIFDIIFNFVDFHVYDQFSENLRDTDEEVERLNHKIENLDKIGYSRTNSLFAFTLNATGGGLSCYISYLPSFINDEGIKQFHRYFKRTLEQIIENADQITSSQKVLLPSERDTLLVRSQETMDQSGLLTAVQLFEEQVALNPDKTALTCGTDELRYSELNEIANQLANYLKTQYNVGANDLIGIELRPSIELIVCIIGVLKSGAAYVPIDPDYPEDRKAYMTNDSNCKVLLDAKEFDVFSLARGNYLNEDNTIPVTTSNLAYVIYTSGSTGRPKGVMIEHKSLSAFLQNCKSRFNTISEESDFVFPLVASTSFDISIFELFLPLLFGGKSLIVKRDGILDFEHLIEVLKGVNGLHAVPALMEQVVQLIRTKHSEASYLSIKDLFIGGDSVPTRVLKELKEVFPQARIHILYGPTEGTIFTTINHTESNLENLLKGSIIGTPNPNTKVYVLDKNKQLLPSGQVGEICIGGAGVARGYLNNDTLTSEKFVDSPFSGEERLYRTGDLGRWMSNGAIEFIGRVDDQVKIRGFRIEIGEIESHLRNHKEVKDALVLARENAGIKQLVGYYVSDQEINASGLRSFLSEKLPDYMLPSFFVHIKAFPLTSNGKVDRKALPEPEITPMEDYIGPSNDIEEKLVEVWSQILNIDKSAISINKSFFEMGGDSIKVLPLTTKINEALGADLTVVQIFRFPTISEITDLVSQGDNRMDKMKEKVEDSVSSAAEILKRFS